ncbi:MAG: cytochrome c-type biogenesis protein CcmH [Anaerolineales bacterium]|nr:cytochrome c-type biogenesis protein CcmH [Anaerolineales bacterium]MDW8162684.1 cytochrome c-type biogenesis protein [Anaerolineales bacterium]
MGTQSDLRWLLLIGIFLSIGLWGGAGTALAQTPDPRQITDDQVNAIAKHLYCPVCENVPLDVCGTQACEQWRQLIRQKLAEGWSEAQIRQYFVEQYGDRVLATPPPRGINWLAYLVPPVAILLGAWILVRAFRGRKHPPSPSTLPQSEHLPPEVVKQIEQELRER